MNWSTILNFLLSPAAVPIIIGLVAGGTRLRKWMEDQKAERQMIQRQQRAREEALRTGKPMDQGTIDLSPREHAQSAKAAGQARLEALRQQRIEQLRKLREQKLGAASTSQPVQSAPRPQSRPIQRPTSRPAPQPARRPAIPTSTPGATRRVANQPNPQVLAQVERQRQLVEQRARLVEQQRRAQQTQSTQQRSAPKAQPVATKQPTQPKKRRLGSLQVNKDLGRHVGTLHADHADQPIESSYHNAIPIDPSAGVKKMLRSPAALRQAVVAAEILGSPVGLR